MSLFDEGKPNLRPEKLHFLLGVRVAVTEDAADEVGAAWAFLLGLVEPPLGGDWTSIGGTKTCLPASSYIIWLVGCEVIA